MHYDFKQAKHLIEAERESISSAYLGMIEDWFWTSDLIYEEGQYNVDLDTVETIAGIAGSYWATPTLKLSYKDGIIKMVPCYLMEE